MTVYATLNARQPFLLPHKAPLGTEGLRELPHVLLEVAVVAEELDVGTIDLDVASSPLLQVLLATERSEAPVLGDDELLLARELVPGAAERLEGVGAVCDPNVSC